MLEFGVVSSLHRLTYVHVAPSQIIMLCLGNLSEEMDKGSEFVNGNISYAYIIFFFI